MGEAIPSHDVLKDLDSREFTLWGMLMWTIHDYLGYNTMGGFAHQEYVGCPHCGPNLGAEHSMELESRFMLARYCVESLCLRKTQDSWQQLKMV